MTKVINLFGGPGVGKSTNATGAFSMLKRKGIRCEYVNEYAKEQTWEEGFTLLQCQQHVFGEQYRRQWRLNGKVDYIITDSPLLLSAVYLNHHNRKLASPLPEDYMRLATDYFARSFFLFDNVNVYVERTKPYDPVGRNQDEQEAKVIDGLVNTMLLSLGGKYDILSDSDGADYDIVDWVLDHAYERGIGL